MYGACELTAGGLTQAQLEFTRPGGGAGIYAAVLEPIAAGEIGRIALTAGPWPLATDDPVAVGETLGPVADQWKAARVGEPVWETVRRAIDGVALVRFLGGGGTPPVYLEVRTSDPESPLEGEMWARSDLF